MEDFAEQEELDEPSEGAAIPTCKSERRARAEEFCGFFNHDWQKKEVGHNCTFTCACLDEADSRKRAHEMVDRMILPVLPELATVHRWCKYQAPSRKICFALGFHSLVVEAFARMARTAADDGT